MLRSLRCVDSSCHADAWLVTLDHDCVELGGGDWTHEPAPETCENRAMAKRATRPKGTTASEVKALRRRVHQLEELCADFYLMMADINPPVRFLDAAVAAASGGPLRVPLKRLTRPERSLIRKPFGTKPARQPRPKEA